MDGVKFALSSIIPVGEKLKLCIARLRTDKSPELMNKMQEMINEFDSKIYNFQDLLPKEKPPPDPEPNAITIQAVETFNSRKQKIYQRYSGEISQINQRYKNLRKQIVANTELYCNKVYELEEKFKSDVEKLENERDKEIDRRRTAVDDEIRDIDQKLRPIKLEFQRKTQAKIEEINQTSENTYKHWQESIASTKQAIEGVEKEYSEKEEFFITSEQEIVNSYTNRCQTIREQQDVEMGKIIDEMNEVKKLIHREKDKVLNIKDRGNIAVTTYHSNYSEMVAKLSKHHTTQMKLIEIKLAEARHKAERLADIYADKSEQFKDIIVVNTSEQDEQIKKEVEKRPKLIEDAVKEKTEEYTKQIELLQTKINNLQTEINSNITEANKIVSSVHKEMNDKLNKIQDANDKEIRELNEEITKIVTYKSKIEGEEKTLRDSTEIIFQSQVNNLNIALTAMKRRHGEEIDTITAREKPIEEFIDYDKLYEDEINKTDSEYRQEEASYEKEKSVLLGVKAEEDKSRGYLETRKQNSPEITAMKETADDLKTKLHDVTARSDSGKAASAAKLESDKKVLDLKLEATINQIEKHHQDKMNMLRKEKETFKNEHDKIQKQLDEAAKRNDEAKVRAKLADEMNARIPEQMKEEAAKKREELLETYINQAFDQNRKVRKLEEQKNKLAEETEKTVRRSEYLRTHIALRKQEYENKIKEGMDRLDHDYSIMKKEQEQLMEKLAQTYKDNKNTLLDEIIDRSKSADELIAKIEKLQNDSKIGIERAIEMMVNELTGEHMNKQKERKKELDAEKKVIQVEIDNLLFEIKKEKNWKAQDNRMALKREFEKMEKEMSNKEEDVDKLQKEVEVLKKKLDEEMNSPCKKCPKVQEEIDFVKKDILDIVTHMQNVELEDSNRNFIATHFGTKSLPPLKN